LGIENSSLLLFELETASNRPHEARGATGRNWNSSVEMVLCGHEWTATLVDEQEIVERCGVVVAV